VARICFVVGPSLLVAAAIVSLLDIDRSSDRWYDNWVEGALLLPGMALLTGAMLGAGAIVAERDGRLGPIAMLTALLGGATAATAAATRIDGSALVDEGASLAILDKVWGEETPYQFLGFAPFIALFFITLLALAVGLWRARDVPRFVPVFIALGTVLFPIAQTSFEVIEPIYVAAVICWLIGFAPLAMRAQGSRAASS